MLSDLGPPPTIPTNADMPNPESSPVPSNTPIVTDSPTQPTLVSPNPVDVSMTPNVVSPQNTNFSVEPDPITTPTPTTPNPNQGDISSYAQSLSQYWNAVDQYGYDSNGNVNFSYDAQGNIVPPTEIPDTQEGISNFYYDGPTEPTVETPTSSTQTTDSGARADVFTNPNIGGDPQVEINPTTAAEDYWSAYNQGISSGLDPNNYGTGWSVQYDANGNPSVQQHGSGDTQSSAPTDSGPTGNIQDTTTVPIIQASGPVGPESSGFGGYGYGGTGIGPNFGGTDTANPYLSHGGVDPMQSTSPTLALTRSAMPESGAELARGGGGANYRDRGISAATAKAAASYWGSGGFSQKAGTSGSTTIG
jgi:hypothetical protein